MIISFLFFNFNFNFHDSNILNHKIRKGHISSYISDLGLCRPVKSSLKKDDIYGIIPFMAPEVLRGKPYTPASDIYSFSMIMWEFTSGVPPFNNRTHDHLLNLGICKGERPKIAENTPKCYVDLMKKCWDPEPTERPTLKILENTISEWHEFIYQNNVNEASALIINDFVSYPNSSQLLDAFKEFTKVQKQADVSIIKSHPQAYHKSRLLDFTKKVNEILDQEEKDCLDCAI